VRIIPVADLMNGIVVHAVGGQREKYKPLQSTLVSTPDPLALALAFERLGLKELYIADLDAICSKGRNLGQVESIASNTKMKLMVDAGFSRADEVEGYIEKGADKIVLATETLRSFDEVSRVIAKYDVRVVGSIDLKFGEVIAGSRAMRLPRPELIRRFEASGASEILLLSLDRVGSTRGPDYTILKEALTHANVPVLVGGGVKDITDVRRLRKQGASGVLIATAFHEGFIGKEDLDHL
jgi:phosphoribosylformimino-5-aminoimidazole carboxamide ribotide isomerase